MLAKRILSALVGIPLLLLIVFLGDPWASIFVGAAVLWGSLEFYIMAQQAGYRPIAVLGVVFGLLFVLNAYLQMNLVLPILTLATLLSFLFLIIRGKTESSLEDWAITIGGIVYVGMMLSYFVMLRNAPFGNNVFWILLTLFCTFASDTAAFFIGSAFGKTRLAPRISPKKSWEGSISGFAASIAVAIALNLVMGGLIPLTHAFALGGLISAAGQVGDLSESLLKRSTHIKDASHLIPGHGGLLDRIDSLIFAVVVVYYYAYWVTL